MALTVGQLNDIKSDMENGIIIKDSLANRSIDYPILDARNEMKAHFGNETFQNLVQTYILPTRVGNRLKPQIENIINRDGVTVAQLNALGTVLDECKLLVQNKLTEIQ
jgi:hypothetical protein